MILIVIARLAGVLQLLAFPQQNGEGLVYELNKII